jgi:hypothetical protein
VDWKGLLGDDEKETIREIEHDARALRKRNPLGALTSLSYLAAGWRSFSTFITHQLAF